MTPLQENINLTINQISDYLAKNNQVTAWQLKVLLKVSSSVLYLALGALYQQGKITLEADGIDYHVTWGKKPAEAVAPAASVAESM